jgi:hypothetical protein
MPRSSRNWRDNSLRTNASTIAGAWLDRPSCAPAAARLETWSLLISTPFTVAAASLRSNVAQAGSVAEAMSRLETAANLRLVTADTL